MRHRGAAAVLESFSTRQQIPAPIPVTRTPMYAFRMNQIQPSDTFSRPIPSSSTVRLSLPGHSKPVILVPKNTEPASSAVTLSTTGEIRCALLLFISINESITIVTSRISFIYNTYMLHN